jgi:hypothetical protein
MSPEKLGQVELADAILRPPLLYTANRRLIIEWGRLARLEQRRLEGAR